MEGLWWMILGGCKCMKKQYKCTVQTETQTLLQGQVTSSSKRIIGDPYSCSFPDVLELLRTDLKNPPRLSTSFDIRSSAAPSSGILAQPPRMTNRSFLSVSSQRLTSTSHAFDKHSRLNWYHYVTRLKHTLYTSTSCRKKTKAQILCLLLVVLVLKRCTADLSTWTSISVFSPTISLDPHLFFNKPRCRQGGLTRSPRLVVKDVSRER